MLCSAAPEKVSALNLKRLKADNKTCGQSQKETPSFRMVFLFGIWQRAGLNSLPRPARSASNPEVRQGSHEWLCHSRDAGSESSLVARTKKERHPHGCLSFLVHHFCSAKIRAAVGGPFFSFSCVSRCRSGGR